jgi:hypothetical protein
LVARDFVPSSSLDVLRFERYAPLMSVAVRTAVPDAESAGFVVIGIQAG